MLFEFHSSRALTFYKGSCQSSNEQDAVDVNTGLLFVTMRLASTTGNSPNGAAMRFEQPCEQSWG